MANSTVVTVPISLIFWNSLELRGHLNGAGSASAWLRSEGLVAAETSWLLVEVAIGSDPSLVLSSI